MTQLFHADLFGRLCNYYEHGDLAYVVAPFIQADVLEGVLAERGGRSTMVLTSWRPDHVWAGASDLRVYDVCSRRGWPLYVSDDLHAKLYSVDLTSAFVGSANVTRRGLGLAEAHNDEVLTFNESLSEEDRVWLLRLIQRARFVTAELHGSMVAWLKDHAADRPQPPPLALPPSDSDPFLINQLPASTSPLRLWEAAHGAQGTPERAAADHDLALYAVAPGKKGYESFRSALALAFRAHPFIAALLEEVERACNPEYRDRRGMHFGAVKAWVQRTCTEVPVPYRRDLTDPVANIIRWCEELLPSEVEVTRPRYSQVLKLRP